MAEKPKFLIFGGVGFIGRNLDHYLVKNELASLIRVADKTLLTTSCMSKEHTESFHKKEVVQCIQANLCTEAGIAKAFNLEGGKFNIVVNLAAETKYGQTDEVYKEKVLDVAVNIGKAAAKQGVDRFIEVSTAQVYVADKKPSNESDKLEPYTKLAKYLLLAENELLKIAGLNVIVLRPALVYGPGDVNGLSPRLIIGAVYKHLKEEMKFLWNAQLKLNTVHVRDVVKAIHLVAMKGEVGKIYNLADKGDTDQGKINAVLEKIFQIQTGFQGTIISNLAKLNFKAAQEAVNEKHLAPWSELCKNAGIENTPLTPYLDPELLYNNPLSIDGSAIEAIGFNYEYPELTEALIREQAEYHIQQGLFPKI